MRGWGDGGGEDRGHDEAAVGTGLEEQLAVHRRVSERLQAPL